VKSMEPEKPDPGPFRMRLPGFLQEEEIGLGDVVRYVTRAAGIQPCGACEQRRIALNRQFVFTGRGR
jgi:hypothetical protein